MRVFVYYNLHRKLWSVKALEGPRKGLVVAHSHAVLLQDATPKVSEAGRQRVLKEKRKNVHAGIVGQLVPMGVEGSFPGFPGGPEVTYNPYKYAGFVYKGDERPYTGSQFAYMDNRKVYVL